MMLVFSLRETNTPPLWIPTFAGMTVLCFGMVSHRV